MSSKTREKIVLVGLKFAGRGVELKELAEEALNDVLRDEAINHRYPVLRKQGSDTLVVGAYTVDFPADMGYGVERVIIDDGKVPLIEKTLDDFVDAGGMQAASSSSLGIPSYYYVDHNARKIQFNLKADKAYSLIIVYYRLPQDIDLGQAGDNVYPWFTNDKLLQDLLTQRIMEYTDDERQFLKEKQNDKNREKTHRGVFPLAGGSARVRMNPSRFPNRRF